ncbi:hypothetical protein B296_00054547 [Ensete ventricosum]|uniref:Uncharacterized protein n=1 Tax=Ensete ventricosum TaxID=4639 RepID=A0A426X1P7_ENSVE|nr:hypothetical protein B296_00054547 [Ensete ventricosum]
MVAIKCKRRRRVAEGGSNDGGVSVGTDQRWLRLLQPKVSGHWARKQRLALLRSRVGDGARQWEVASTRLERVMATWLQQQQQ